MLSDHIFNIQQKLEEWMLVFRHSILSLTKYVYILKKEIMPSIKYNVNVG